MYKLTDFVSIAKKNTYRIPSSVIQLINSLCVEIKAEPTFEFTQEIRHTKQDVIRELNKITETSSFETFLSILNEENVVEFSEDIFTILTSNSYLMKTYCKLFLELCEKYPVFLTILTARTAAYKESFSVIQFGDPSDYDLFCKINQENQSRKMYSQFISVLDHLRKTNEGEHISAFLMERIDSLLNSSSKDIVHECIEHIAILSKYKLYHREKIEAYCNLDPKTTSGIHTKFIFTCMDILNV